MDSMFTVFLVDDDERVLKGLSRLESQGLRRSAIYIGAGIP
jgi:hypothetical protein